MGGANLDPSRREAARIAAERSRRARGLGRAEQFYETHLASMIEWDETDHPREPAGSPEGGQWIAKDGGGGGAGSGESPSSLDAALLPSQDAAGQTIQLAAATGASSKAAKGSEHSPAPDPKAKYLSDFDQEHDLSLRVRLKMASYPREISRGSNSPMTRLNASLNRPKSLGRN